MYLLCQDQPQVSGVIHSSCNSTQVSPFALSLADFVSQTLRKPAAQLPLVVRSFIVSEV